MTKKDSGTVVNLNRIKVACKDCSLRELCLPVGLEEADLKSLDGMIKRTQSIKKGEYLYRTGDPLTNLFAISAGSIKTSELAHDGNIQITGFHLPGELLGIDAISNDKHPCDAVALEATDVCVIPLESLEDLARQIPGLQRQLLRIMSREIVNDETLLMMLGKMNADVRLASCLLSFSDRYSRLGFSGVQFKLTMSRQDLGDYLGLALETVSRLFSRFQEEGLIRVDGKRLELLDLAGLAALVGGDQDHASRKWPVA